MGEEESDLEHGTTEKEKEIALYGFCPNFYCLIMSDSQQPFGRLPQRAIAQEDMNSR